MRKLIMTAAAAALATTALAAAATPAAAQDYGWRDRPTYDLRADDRAGGGYDDGLRDRIARLDRWIDGARLAPWQARNAQASLRGIRDRERELRWRQGGRLNGYQVSALNARLDGLADFMRRAMRGEDGRRW